MSKKIQEFVTALKLAKDVHNQCPVQSGNKFRKQIFFESISDNAILEIFQIKRGDFPSEQKYQEALNENKNFLEILLSQNKSGELIGLLEEKAKTKPSQQEEDRVIGVAVEAIKLFGDENLRGWWVDTIGQINQQEIILKKDWPRLVPENVSSMKDGSFIKASYTYEGQDIQGKKDDKYNDFYLVKNKGKLTLLCEKLDGEFSCQEINDFDEVQAAIVNLREDRKHPQLHHNIEHGYFVLVDEPREVKVRSGFNNEEDVNLMWLLQGLEARSENLSSEEKSQLLMISQTFTADNGVSELFKRSLNVDETKDLLRFLSTKDLNSVSDTLFAARLIICDQEKLSSMRSVLGSVNSFAAEFFQGSQHAQFTKDKAVTLGGDSADIDSEPNMVVRTKRQKERQEVLDGKKYCLCNGEGGSTHYFGLVFGKIENGSRNVYIQDSTENITQDIQANYNRSIEKMYPLDQRNGVQVVQVKTTQKADQNEQIFAGEAVAGIQNQCRYSAIIFSERVLGKLSNDEKVEASSIRYGQIDFEEKFAQWFDESLGKTTVNQLGSSASNSSNKEDDEEFVYADEHWQQEDKDQDEKLARNLALRDVLGSFASNQSDYHLSVVDEVISHHIANRDSVKIIRGGGLSSDIRKGFHEFINSEQQVLVMPMLKEQDGKTSQHITGLYIKKNHEKEPRYDVVYFDPTGKGKPQQIPKHVRKLLEEQLKVKEDDIVATTNEIQHTKPSEKGDVSPYQYSNNHCGPFVAKVLSDLAVGKFALVFNRLFHNTQKGWEDFGDARKEKVSDEFGIRLRNEHRALLKPNDELILNDWQSANPQNSTSSSTASNHGRSRKSAAKDNSNAKGNTHVPNLNAQEFEVPWAEKQNDKILITPSTHVKATLASPLMIEGKSVWHEMASKVSIDTYHLDNTKIRANKFKVVDKVKQYKNEDGSLNKENIQQTFIDIITKLSVGTEGNEKPSRGPLSLAQIITIIEKAKDVGGISNKVDEQDGSYSKIQSEDLAGVSAVEAKKFSKAFQKECEACGIYSGREGGKSVGLRLTFIPDDVVQKLKDEKDQFKANIAEAKGRINEIKGNETLKKIEREKSSGKSH